jgi:hypothetical protein
MEAHESRPIFSLFRDYETLTDKIGVNSRISPIRSAPMGTVQEVLETAGVKAGVLESVRIDPERVVHIVSIGSADGMETAKKFLAVSENTGYVPLFIENEDYDDYMENLVDNHRRTSNDGSTFAAKLIAAGESLDVDEWMAKHGNYKDEIGDFSKSKTTWSKIPTAEKLILVPVKNSWQIPAVIYFGGWNSCPRAEVHIAMHKRWHDKYRSELVALGKDAVYCFVNKPIRTRDDALLLAKEQAVYCHDNVDQGSGDGTISGLAVDLLDATAWSFWWD